MKSAGPVPLVLVLLTIPWTSSLPTKESTTRRYNFLDGNKQHTNNKTLLGISDTKTTHVNTDTLNITHTTSSRAYRTTTRPSQPQIGDTIKQLTSQLMNVNATDFTLDTRTPPKVKQQMKKPPRKEEVTLENSHPGVAVPMEDTDLILEESTKKFNFYKIESKSTTDRGLSTWVLLNSQTVSPASSTTKTSRKPPIKQKLEESKNITVNAEIFNKITKPLFKKRPLPTTTKKPIITTARISTIAEKDHKLTKIKASVLNSAINNKTEANNSNKKPNATLNNSNKESTLPIDDFQEITTTKSNDKVFTAISSYDNELIPSIEAKDDEMELMTTTQSSKKTRRPTTKRKKNKKRRRPSIDRSDTNSTKLSNKINQKEKPISTQIYNYLSREIIPTVGVGLVGLMVTAGLASYFLYPFGVARRSYEVDRKDKEGSYYYNDEYAPGGVAEEDMLGQVIAGMPENSNYQNYRSPASRDAYSNYKQADYDYKKSRPSSSADAIYLTPSRKYPDKEDAYISHRNHKPDYYNPQRNYDKDIFEHSQETGYTVEDKQFVVGNIPKEIQEATPAVVPEHGPRNLPETTTSKLLDSSDDFIPRTLPEIFEKKEARTFKLRKRRSSDLENEIPSRDDDSDNRIHPTSNKKIDYSLSTEKEVPAKMTPTTDLSNRPQSFFTYLMQFWEANVKLGLEFLQSTARAFSKYLSDVQRRFANRENGVEGKEQPRNQ